MRGKNYVKKIAVKKNTKNSQAGLNAFGSKVLETPALP